MTQTTATTTTTAAPQLRAPGPEILRRVDRIDGCNGRWLLSDSLGAAFYGTVGLGEWFGSPVRGVYRAPHDAAGAAHLCAATGWRLRLLWHSAYLDDDCAWPGGYDAPSIYRSNARVWREDHKATLALDPDGGTYEGAAFDVRYCDDSMLEALEALEGYPLLDDCDHSELEWELQQEEWEGNYCAEWERALASALDEHLPERALEDGDDIVARLDAGQVRQLFEVLADSAGVYWEEEQSAGFWIDVERVARGLTLEELQRLTGRTLADAETAPAPRVYRVPADWPRVPITRANGEDGGTVPAAWVGAYIAVTPPAFRGVAGEWEPREWVMTHCATGYSAARLLCSKRRAVAIAREWDARFASLERERPHEWEHCDAFCRTVRATGGRTDG